MDAVIYQPIGVINTPFIDEAPRQPMFSNETGTVTIFDEYVQGLKNIEQHSHVVLIFHLHQSKEYTLLTMTPWSNEVQGVFATRSPNRPNGIGLSVVELDHIKENVLYVKHVDMLDGTPLLDIKPFIKDPI